MTSETWSPESVISGVVLLGSIAAMLVFFGLHLNQPPN